MEQALSEVKNSWLHWSVVRCCIILEYLENYIGKELLSKKDIKQVIMEHNLSESTISWTASFSCSLLHDSGIPLIMCSEATSLKEKHQTANHAHNLSELTNSW